MGTVGRMDGYSQGLPLVCHLVSMVSAPTYVSCTQFFPRENLDGVTLLPCTGGIKLVGEVPGGTMGATRGASQALPLGGDGPALALEPSSVVQDVILIP